MTISRWQALILFAILMVISAALTHSAASAQAPAVPPVVIAGNAWVDGQPAPPGAWVVAVQDGQELARGVVRAGGRFGPMEIPRPPVSAPISFMVAGNLADFQLQWNSGARLLEDLRASSGGVPATVAPAQLEATATPAPRAWPVSPPCWVLPR